MMDEHIQLIEDCERRESRLSEWEVGFIASLREQLERGRSLSDKQIDVLDRVWDQATTDFPLQFKR